MKKILFVLILVFMTSTVYAKSVFVSTAGSDSTTYANNDINSPWLTAAKAFGSTDLQPGDNVYFRTGTYDISSEVTQSNTADGTSGNPITFSPYNDEAVTLTGDDRQQIWIERDYYTVDGFTINSHGTFFEVGWNHSASNFTVTNCAFTNTLAGGGVNIGSIVFRNNNSEDGLVQYCTFVGPGEGVNANTAGVFVFRAQGIKVLNCQFEAIPNGIFYKHTCVSSDTGIEFAYNYFEDCHYSILNVAQYSNVHDNIMVDSKYKTGVDGGSGDDGDERGSDYNTINHNTFYNCTIELWDGAGDGADQNTITNNIFIAKGFAHAYSSDDPDMTSDYNLYNSGDIWQHDRSGYNLSEWRSFAGGDSNSIQGSPTYSGGSSPSSIAGFALTSGSDGYEAGSDSKDLGADVSLVGVSGGGAPPNTEPDTPIIDSVGIENESFGTELIYQDDYENTNLSTDYSNYETGTGTSCLISTTEGLGGSGKSLENVWESAQVDAGGVQYFFGRNPAGSETRITEDFDEIYWRFYVKTDDGWSGDPYKLTRAYIMSTAGWLQAMIAHVWTGNGSATIRSDPKTFINGSVNECTTYNDQVNGTWLGGDSCSTEIYAASNAGQWFCVEVRVKLNDSGVVNGEQDIWIDGVLEDEQTGINWIGSWAGGYSLNVVQFSGYWNTGAPGARQRFIDNFVISTERIGFAKSSVNPVIYKTDFSDDDSGDTQGGFQAQVSTNAGTGGLVWTGSVSNTGNEITVNTIDGSFQGARSGETTLDTETVYYTRVRQSDNFAAYSGYSGWKIFETEDALTTIQCVGATGSFAFN